MNNFYVLYQQHTDDDWIIEEWSGGSGRVIRYERLPSTIKMFSVLREIR